MRSTSKKLLLWLYSPDQAWTVSPDDVELLLPDLTPGGRRSLLSHLQREQYLLSETITDETRLRLTEYGRRSVESSFPALAGPRQDWQGEWAQLVFLSAPAADPRFRNLRKVVLEAGAGQLTRGVYLYPQAFPPAIIDLCQQLYRGHVLISQLGEWQFGDERSVMEEFFVLSDAAATYSGISKEIKQLLSTLEPPSSLTHSQKQAVFTVFDRLVAQLESDIGLVPYYFPQVPSSLSLLRQLHRFWQSQAAV